VKNFLVVVILAALALFMYFGPKAEVAPEAMPSVPAERAVNRGAPVAAYPGLARQHFSCDGRTSCSQMTSCEEAMYFLDYCPNTKMDGNNDGVPCERQWCN
jgi:hypothetical protein